MSLKTEHPTKQPTADELHFYRQLIWGGSIVSSFGLLKVTLRKMREIDYPLANNTPFWYLAFLVLPAVLPLESLMLFHLAALYRCMLTEKLSGLPARVYQWVTLWAAGGVSFGLYLSVLSKMAPMLLRRVLFTLVQHAPHLDLTLLERLPKSTHTPFGIAFTAISEFLILPSIGTMLPLFGVLKHLREDFDHPPRQMENPLSTPEVPTSPRLGEENKQKKELIVMIHGDEFNESQWLWGRLLLQHQEENPVELMTVNYLYGMFKIGHVDEETDTIARCAQLVLDQIEMQMTERSMDEDEIGRIVLMGHSLGGLISAHLVAHEDDIYHKSKLRILNKVSDVVLWSAPLQGSEFVYWLKQTMPRLVQDWFGLQEGIKREFCPTHENLEKMIQNLLTKSRRSSSSSTPRVRVMAITGECDPLVRPKSALLLDHVKQDDGHHQVTYPHLGHFNIKIHLPSWLSVIEYLDKRRQEEAMKAS